MNTQHRSAESTAARYELRFAELNRAGRALAFPCDATGAVDVAALSPTLGESYRRARSRIGRDLAYPSVLPAVLPRLPAAGSPLQNSESP